MWDIPPQKLDYANILARNDCGRKLLAAGVGAGWRGPFFRLCEPCRGQGHPVQEVTVPGGRLAEAEVEQGLPDDDDPGGEHVAAVGLDQAGAPLLLGRGSRPA